MAVASLPLAQAMAENAALVERQIGLMLPKSDLPEARLFDAMRHACLNGGKRLRPFLVMEGAKLFGVDPGCALRVAAAIEFMHCYSLVHDDLPAMDNSDLRRGQPTVHKLYDDATAILAGDALLTLSFEVLAEPDTHADPQVRVALVQALAKAAGGRGMVGGQMLDIIAETTVFELHTVSRLQRMKTGELIAFSAEAGAILGKASAPQRQALRAYAHDLGLAFQIADDLLDAEGDTETAGKPVGQDADLGKATFVSIQGVERARAQARMLVEQAERHLAIFEGRAEMLRAVARFVIDRRH
ncbi:polyprenyl synthetase family protein [Radicibacter daui]|uniref:polyprenyl synthetase family protein n=1 Tax=Radicibacter daui TaxID=3064829 RepID=UPI004046D7DA